MYSLEPAIHDLYFCYGVASATVLTACLLIRMICGASPVELFRTRFYEIPPLRLVFRVTHLGLLGLVIALLVTAGFQLVAWFNVGEQGHMNAAIALVSVALTAAALAWLVHAWFVHIESNEPPRVSLRHVDLGTRLNAKDLAEIGCRQFPQMIAFGHTSGLWVRRGLVITSIVSIVVAIVAATEWGVESGLRELCLGVTARVREWVPAATGPANVMTGLTCVLALVLLYVHNHTYTLVTFPRSLVLLALLTAGLFASVAPSPLHSEWILVGGVAGLALWGVRWSRELVRASGYQRVRDHCAPLQALIADRVRFLPGLRQHPDYQLSPLDTVEISERISRGCRNVESTDRLVSRNFARFLSLVRVDYEACATAMIRLLTVRRFVRTFCTGGTNAGYRCPQVPLWNEQLFPLQPPRGYVNSEDPLHLGSSWDIVCNCGVCGGSGRVSCPGCGGSGTRSETEYYTEYSNGQTRTCTRMVTRTCGGCGGSGRQTCQNCQGCGRVLLQQILVTQWQRLLPAVVDPGVHIPDFMEDAEEQEHYRMPLVEDRTVIKPASAVVSKADTSESAMLQQKMHQAGLDLAASLPEITELVETLHDGKLYRADFTVAGFWTLGLAFRFLPGKRGWFFGSRPEFHFPALPLSWGMVGTVLFVLPFLVATFALGAEHAREWLCGVLPTLPNSP